MKNYIDINPAIIPWAIERAGLEAAVLFERFPNVQKWILGEKKPTVSQLQEFSQKVYLPFGYFFLPEPPVENLPIPFFRSINPHNDKIHINVRDTILLLLQRQDWLRNYLKENEFKPLGFVGKYRDNEDIKAIVSDIRQTLQLPENWASGFSTWREALAHLIAQIEDKGIITVINGVVENNTHRKIPVDECRGFVLVDEYAPFVFVNNSDWKSAQMFTLAHELAHIWTGFSAGFDLSNLQPADNKTEKLCDSVAAEFLVPEETFTAFWNQNQDIGAAAKSFKVSEIVIARRALDTGKLSKAEFFRFWEAYSARQKTLKENSSSGGDFYNTTGPRISKTFAGHINRAVKSGQLLYRDAYKLTGLKGDTFEKFFTKTGY